MESAVINATKAKVQEPVRARTVAAGPSLAANLVDVRSPAVLLPHVPHPTINIVISNARNILRRNKGFRDASTVRTRIRLRLL